MFNVDLRTAREPTLLLLPTPVIVQLLYVLVVDQYMITARTIFLGKEVGESVPFVDSHVADLMCKALTIHVKAAIHFDDLHVSTLGFGMVGSFLSDRNKLDWLRLRCWESDQTEFHPC